MGVSAIRRQCDILAFCNARVGVSLHARTVVAMPIVVVALASGSRSVA